MPTEPNPAAHENAAADASLTDAWLALRLDAFARKPGFRRASAAAETRAFLATGLARARARGTFARYERGGAARAVVAVWEASESWYCVPTLVGAVDLDPDDPEAVAFAVETLAGWLADGRIDERFDTALDHAYLPVLHGLLAGDARWGIDSVQLVGDPGRARRALDRRGIDGRRDRLAMDGGEAVVRVATPADVDAIVALKLRLFRERPEFCWFYANPGFADAEATHLGEALAGPDGRYELAIAAGGEVVGFWAADVRESALWGRCAGMDVVLDPRLQGRGHAWTLYRRLVDAMVAADVEVMKGGTAQPGVMRVARALERPPLAWQVRLDTPFAPAHFAAIEPSLAAPGSDE